MPRQWRPDRRGGDGLYQLPIVDLVAQTEPVPLQAQQELDELGQLLQFSADITREILDRARELLQLIDALDAAQRCPDSLRNDCRLFCLALGLHVARSPNERRGEGMREGGIKGGWKWEEGLRDSAAVNKQTDTEGENSNRNSTGVVKGAAQPFTRATLLQYLEDLGYRGAANDLKRYGLKRLAGAVNYACSRNTGSVNNLARYIRWAAQKGISADPPEASADRYSAGRYGHVVKR